MKMMAPETMRMKILGKMNYKLAITTSRKIDSQVQYHDDVAKLKHFHLRIYSKMKLRKSVVNTVFVKRKLKSFVIFRFVN